MSKTSVLFSLLEIAKDRSTYENLLTLTIGVSNNK